VLDFNNEKSRITTWAKNERKYNKKKFNRFKVKEIVRKTDTMRANKMATGVEIVPIAMRVPRLRIFVNGIK